MESYEQISIAQEKFSWSPNVSIENVTRVP
jgi:hypothetical protein